MHRVVVAGREVQRSKTKRKDALSSMIRDASEAVVRWLCCLVWLTVLPTGTMLIMRHDRPSKLLARGTASSSEA